MEQVESARYWRVPSLPGVELLIARYHRQEFAPHWHDDFVVPVVERGVQSYLYAGRTNLAGPGHIAAINPGEVHTAKRGSDAGWAYRAFYPSVAFMRQLADGMRDRVSALPWLATPTIADDVLAAQLLHAHYLVQANADTLESGTALIRAMSTLLIRYAGVKPASSLRSPNRERVARMLELLAENLGGELTLAQLAAAVDLSPFYAAHLFSQQMGMPPHAWRNQLRLHRARTLMRGAYSVADAAVASGFADQSHLTRHFKKAYGMPPGRWKTG
jgi:AraC-like DNA-binding protein